MDVRRAERDALPPIFRGRAGLRGGERSQSSLGVVRNDTNEWERRRMRVVDRGVNEIWRGRARDEGVAPPPPGDQERPKYKWRYIYI